MPKVTVQQTNFTAGELTPRMRGRVDVARYANGAEIIENAWPQIHGGVERRWGTLFQAPAKLAAQKARVVPFVFSRTQAYVLEFGAGYMRVFKPEGQVLLAGVPYEIATPYSEAQVAELDFTQGADTMFLWHQQVPPQRLRRFADDRGVLDATPFNPAPFDELGFRPATTLALSAGTMGAGRTATAGAATFLATDVGREIWAGTGTATITAVGSPTSATVTISAAFGALAYASGAWQVRGSPQATLTPGATGPIGSEISLTLGASTLGPQKAIQGLSWAAGTAQVTLTAHGYSSGNTVIVAGVTDASYLPEPSNYNGTHLITVVGPDTFTFPLAADPGGVTGLGTAQLVAASTADGWRAADVGKFVRINGGLVRITGYVSPTLASGEVMVELAASVPAIASSWSLNATVWNATDGYPGTGTLHQQRLIAASSPSYPQKIWGSAIDGYFDFLLGTIDDEAFDFTLASDDVNPITFMVSMESLVALTYGGEFTVEGGVEKPITPTNVKVKPRSNSGCARVRPVGVGREQLFVQRAGRRVRAIGYNEELSRWSTPDMSVLAEHLTRGGVASLTWQDDPGSLVMAVLEDGRIATATYDRDQDVVGWARQITDGAFESACSIPAAAGDQTWVIVRRTIGGLTVRYVERFDAGVLLDCAIVGSHPTGASVWSGLAHLNDKTVDIVADGVPMPRQVVTAGAITLPRNAKAVAIGLPYTSRIKLLPPEVAGQLGSAQGSAMDVGEVYVRFLETVGCQVNGQPLAFRQFGPSVLDQAVQPYSGLKKIENLGWADGESDVEISQPQPLPWTVLCVIRKWTFNQG